MVSPVPIIMCLLMAYYVHVIKTLRPRKMAAIFQTTFSNTFSWILINISLKFVPRGPINNIPSLVQIMAWCWPGDKPLSEPMMVHLLTHIYASLCLSELSHQHVLSMTLFIRNHWQDEVIQNGQCNEMNFFLTFKIKVTMLWAQVY